MLLSKEKREIFHSVIARGIFICTRCRPDGLRTVGVLTGRVREPNQSNWNKGRRLVRYFACNRELHLILRYDRLRICKCSVDAAFMVYPEFKSQSRGLTMMRKMVGGMASDRTKQKLNRRSSTEAKIVSSDDFITNISWCKNFLG